jgi:PAS domain S-box-containing protein
MEMSEDIINVEKGDAQALRQRAEARHAKSVQDVTLFEKEPSSILHELQVHQIELEIQNEELRASQALVEESRKQFIELYEFAPVGYCTLDTSGIIQQVNLTLVFLLNYSRSYVLSKPLPAFIHSEDKDKIFLFLRRLRQTTGQQRCELRLKKNEEQFVFVELTGVPLTVQENTEIQFLVTILDITDRKLAEEELRRQRGLLELNNEYLNSVLNGIKDAFLVIDATGRLSYLNHNAEILFRRDSDAVLGKHFSVAFST